MQINRLFEITYLLIERGRMTAAELAERFEVSTRTIYRDLEILSGAGIPVYTDRGKGGGIRMMEQFVLGRSLLTEGEQDRLLAGLQGLSALDVPEAKAALQKLAALFGRPQNTWLEVDLSPWGDGADKQVQFSLLQEAVQCRRVIVFDYFGANGVASRRQVEPLKLLFKGRGWYLYGFCRQRQGFRLFKCGRMRRVELTGEQVTREAPDMIFSNAASIEMITLRLHLDAGLAYRVYDEFPPEQVERLPDGGFLVKMQAAAGEWVFSFLLSLGPQAQVLGPAWVREGMQKRLEQMRKAYQTPHPLADEGKKA
ncbi:helix-turn-helix transcriptional regulator [Anaerotruncus rubiinfantis]|uniref:helix-turn-helix transcriptional regulator n=1 Tax=Anaerotruncus rubiinfantis TaxID=1720200 RepID=UPI0034A3CEF8